MAVNGAEAAPLPSVASPIVDIPLLNFPLAPVAGAVNVTYTPGNGLLFESLTVTANGLTKSALTIADWGVVPGLAVMFEGTTARFVSVKLALTEPLAAVTR